MSEKSLKERFQEKLQGSRWTGSTNNIGYPKMKVDGEMVLGSHVALRLAGRKAPTGGPAGGNIVMHKDNNKLNLSPSNLEVGTHKENLKQMRDEGRDRPRGVHQEPDEKTARVRGPVKAMRRAMELLQDGSTAYHTSSSYNVSRAAEDRLLKAGRGQVHGKGVYFQLGKPADMYGSAAVAIPGSHAGGLKALPPAVDGVAGPDYWRMHQGDNFPLPSKAVLVGSGYYGAHPTTIASADLEMRSAARKGRLRHIGVGPWEAALDASEKVASTDIDILKFAFKLQGHTEFQEIPIAIENRKGSVRKGTDKDGKPWRTVMRMPYGFVKGTKGADGEEIDCYIGPHKNAPNVYAVHQHKSDGTGYDEDKLIFGVRSKEEASKRYLQHYNSDKFLGPVKEVPVERLKEMLSTGKKLEKISTSLCARVLRRG